MISSFDYYKQIESPNMYLCNPDQRPICAINGRDRHCVLRFNDLSELTFTVPKIAGTEDNYNLIETKRLIFVENIGWFQITNVSESMEGEKISKSVTAESHQTSLKTRGFVTEERVYMFYNPNDPMDALYDSSNLGAIPSVVGQLYQQLGIKIALQVGDIEPDRDYGDWTIIYIEDDLKFKAKSYNQQYESAAGVENICRTFSEGTTYGYDFIVNDVEEAFQVIFEFDFLHHTIKVKKLESITLPTNIYLSFDNLVTALSITEEAENIVTVLSCNGNDLDIRTVNPMGTNYIVNFDYYKKHKSDDGKILYPWMSRELIETLDEWEAEWLKWQDDDENRTGHTKSYSNLVKELQKLYTEQSDISSQIQYANLKLTDLQAARDQYHNAGVNGDAGLVVAEDVDVNETSLLNNSAFYSSAFTDQVNIVGHTSAPIPTQIIDEQDANGNATKWHYEFSFTDTGTSGTPKDLIVNFIDSDNETDNLDVPFYFIDDTSKRSYCKLQVASEVGVVKDADGFISANGTVEVRDVIFTVQTYTDSFIVIFPNGTQKSISKSNSYFVYNNVKYKVTSSADGITSVYCYYVSGFERFITNPETAGDSGWCTIWENYINTELTPIDDDLGQDIETIEEELAYINERCNIQKYVKNKSQTLYDELFHYWVEGEYQNDNLAVLDTTTMSERIDLANELMAAGKTDLAKSSQPMFEMSVQAVNFIRLLEFKAFTKELILGRVITIEKSEDLCYMPAFIGLEFDLDDSESFVLSFSNAGKPNETAMTFADLIQESASTTRTVSANWSNLMDYTRNKELITNLIQSPLDRTLRAAQANMANQQFVVDTTGILGRKWDDDSHTSFMPEQIRIINNTILFTDDNWETAALALGKVEYGDNGVVAYGLVADVLVGSLMIGSKLKIQNESNTIALDNNGISIKDNNDDLVFAALTSGNVYVRGEIYATKLTLASGVTIAYEAIADAPDLSKYTTEEEVDDKLEFKISKDDNDQIVSMFNLVTDMVTITSTNFKLTADGTITATAGRIGVLTINSDGSIVSDNTGFSVDAEGNLIATSGNIGAFSITDDGLESEYIKLNKQEIRFPIQSSFNLNDEVLIYTTQTNGENTSYITTVNSSNFVIQNLTGAGIMFSKDKVSVTQTINVTVNGPSLTSAGDKGNALVINYSIPSTASGWVASYDFTYTATLSAPLPYPYTKTAYVRYMYNIAKTEYRTKEITLSFPAFTTSISGSVNLDSWGEANTRYNPNDTRFETGIYFSSYSRSNQATDVATSYSSTNNTLYSLGNFTPNTDKTYSLGANGNAWGNLYLYTGTQVGSDIRLKNTIEELSENFDVFFDSLKPASYILNDGTSGRKHIGFIAQDVEQGLINAQINTKDFAGLCIPSDNELYYMLRYEEFIALNTSQIQKLKSRVSELEKELKELKGETK